MVTGPTEPFESKHTLNSAKDEVDVAIVGAGPGGCSCALWLQQLGWRCALVDHQPEICATLAPLDFKQNWVLGQPDARLCDIGQSYAVHLHGVPGLVWALGQTVQAVQRQDDGRVQLRLRNGQSWRAKALVLATGMKPVWPAEYRDLAQPGLRLWDATGLTLARERLSGLEILLLGGGDNAVENAVFLNQRGNRVTVWARQGLRAAPSLVRDMAQHSSVRVRLHTPMPTLQAAALGQFQLSHAGPYDGERYDAVAVLFGFEPALGVLSHFTPPVPPDLQWPGLFLAGDVSQRLHPSVSTAVADGITAAKQVQRWLSHPPTAKAHASMDTAS